MKPESKQMNGKLVEQVPEVFISHAEEDKDFAMRLVNDLRTKGYFVWCYEQGVKAGDSLFREIEDALCRCDHVVTVLSPAGVKSRGVHQETDATFARETSEQRNILVPILKENCEIPLLLRSRWRADFRESYERGFEELLGALPESPIKSTDKTTDGELLYLLEVGDTGFTYTGMHERRPEMKTIVASLMRKNLVSAYGGSNILITLTDEGWRVYFNALDFDQVWSTRLGYELEEVRRDEEKQKILHLLRLNHPKPVPHQEIVGRRLSEQALQSLLGQEKLVAVEGQYAGPHKSYRLNRFGLAITRQLSEIA